MACEPCAARVGSTRRRTTKAMCHGAVRPSSTFATPPFDSLYRRNRGRPDCVEHCFGGFTTGITDAIAETGERPAPSSKPARSPDRRAVGPRWVCEGPRREDEAPPRASEAFGPRRLRGYSGRAVPARRAIGQARGVRCPRARKPWGGHKRGLASSEAPLARSGLRDGRQQVLDGWMSDRSDPSGGI
jgi:hypothetical protein